MNGFTQILNQIPEFNDLTNGLLGGLTPISVTGFSDSASAHLIFSLCEKLGRKALIITQDEFALRKITEDLTFFTKGNILSFPQTDLLFYDIEAASGDILRQRLNVLEQLMENPGANYVVTGIDALRSVTVPCGVYTEHCLTIRIGDSIELDKLTKSLILLGYTRENQVEGRDRKSTRLNSSH